MKLLCSKILALQLLLFVVAAIAVLGACGSEESAPAVAIAPTETAAPATVEEEWPPAPRPTPTPGAMLGLPTPEPSSLADEAYAILDALTTQYSPRDVGSDHEMGAALSLQGRLSATGYDTSLQEFGSSYTFRSSYMFYTDDLVESDEAEAISEPIRPHLLPGLPVSPPRGFATGPLIPVGDTSQMDIPDHGVWKAGSRS